jgi:uncharacterized GH25 family protein
MHQRDSLFVLIVAVLLALSDATDASPSANPSGPGSGTAQVAITGKVSDVHGRPVDGAKVTLYYVTYAEQEFLRKAKVVQEKETGVDGTFRLTGAQEASSDSYRMVFIVAHKTGLALGWAEWRLPIDRQYSLVLGEPRDLGGDVVNERGQPVGEAEVRIALAGMGRAEERRPLVTPSFLSVTTDDKGHFLFANMPAEATFEFLVHKPACATLDTSLQALLSDPSSLPSMAEIDSGAKRCRFAPGQTGIKLTLPLGAKVEGVVVEKTSGKPVGGVQVTARADRRQAGLLPPGPVTTTPDGTFAVAGLAAGTWFVQLATGEKQAMEWVAAPVRVSLVANETKSGVRLELSKGGVIEVLVKDTAGRPVTRAIASVRDRYARYLDGLTDANGLARIRVPPGQYEVPEPLAPGYIPQIRQEHVSIEANETKRVEFVLRPAPRGVNAPARLP